MDERLRLEFNDWARAGRGESMERGHRPTGEQAIDRMQLLKSNVLSSAESRRVDATQSPRRELVRAFRSQELTGFTPFRGEMFID